MHSPFRQLLNYFLGSYSFHAELLQDDNGVAAALVRQGLIPSAPFLPHVAITTRVLELFRTTHLRCPHLAVQPFVKSLCDLHGVPFRPTLSRQFSISFDVYLRIRDEVSKRVHSALNQDTPNW